MIIFNKTLRTEKRKKWLNPPKTFRHSQWLCLSALWESPPQDSA